MGRGVVFITASLSSVFQKLIDICYFTGHLLMIVVSFCVLENVLCIKELFVNVFRGKISATYNKDFCRHESGCLRLSSLYFFEELLEDPHQGLEIC